ncbi:MerR family transcriptional regulator [Streptomyces sp. BI20]|uniref:MerR family transcriptional regulator n=1 Tax=Streptomyces sp. BI20 TaxID=3403460 RepID=UPI003C72677C
MRIGELSDRTGVSVATIKYYVREGLLPPGRLTSPNQAAYDTAHEHRLRVIRAMVDVGGLSVTAVREVLRAVDDRERPVFKLLGAAAEGVVPRHPERPGADLESARARVESLVERRGWRTEARSPAGEALAAALAAVTAVGHPEFLDVLDSYADAAEGVAAADLAYVAAQRGRERMVESVVVGTVLGDAVFAAVRRLAQTDAAAGAFPPPARPEDAAEGDTESGTGAGAGG